MRQIAEFAHFNSIKVRLKHIKEIEVPAQTEFQFHKGTIKTRDIHYTVGKKPISIP